MLVLNRLFGRQPDPAVDPDPWGEVSLEQLVAASVRITNVRVGTGLEPVQADLEVATDWGVLLVRDVGLADPDGQARVVYPFISRGTVDVTNGKRKHAAYVEAVELPEALRLHVRSVLADAWSVREQ